MPAKVLEVLYRELDGEKVKTLRLLSGPADVTDDLKHDFKRFRTDEEAALNRGRVACADTQRSVSSTTIGSSSQKA